MGPPYTGHFRVIVDTPRGLQPLHPGTKLPQTVSASHLVDSPAAAGEAQAVGTNLDLRKTIYQSTYKGAKPIDGAEAATLARQADDSVKASTSGPLTFSCNTCGTDCSRQRYHAINVKDFTLCSNCYLEGRFPSSMFSGDFIRMESAEFKHGGANANEEDWTDEELLRLLEGLEMFDDDWSAVANHVGTRTREQCIMKFVQLPIEDPYLDGGASAGPTENGKHSTHPSVVQRDLGPLQYVRDPKLSVPFAQADNPVMSVVAFLASAVSPAVAAAAAQSALGELTDGIRRRQKEKQKGPETGAESAATKEAETAEKKTDEGKEADGMDVDKDGDKPDEPTASSRAAGVNGEPSATIAEAQDSASDTTKAQTVQAREDREDSGAPAEVKSKPPPEAIPKNSVEKAAAIALGAAAAKAHVLASFEERECQKLVSQVVEAQMRKMEVSVTIVLSCDGLDSDPSILDQIKLAHFEELETMLEAERRTVEASRKQLYHDRLAVQRQLAQVNELLRKAQTAPQTVTPAALHAASSAANGLPGQGPVIRQAPNVPHPQGGSMQSL